MSKDSASTRIPRLDGASRIPLPGSLRPPSASGVVGGQNAVTAGIPAARTTQIFQRTTTTTTGLHAQKRPTTLAGLRPPTSIALSNALKRSASGDHITNAMSLVSRKTTTVLKKWMGKPDRVPSQPTTMIAPPSKSQIGMQKNRAKTRIQTPPTVAVEAPSLQKGHFHSPARTLTRSETFVRTGDNPVGNDVSQFEPSGLTQSTPAPGSNADSSNPARNNRPPNINETTQLLCKNTRHALYTAQSLDTTTQQISTPPPFGETFETSAKRSMNMDDAKHDKRTSIGLLKGNLCTTFNASVMLGKTMNVVSTPGDIHTATFLSKPQLNDDDTAMFLENTPSKSAAALSGTRIIDSADALSPITNATYSNPDSLDNLQLLEDVSAPSGFLEMDLTLQSDCGSEHERTRDNILDCSDPEEDPEDNELNSTLKAFVGTPAPEKTHMKLPLNSKVKTGRLLDLTTTNMLNSPKDGGISHKMLLTQDYLEKTRVGASGGNTSQLLYITQTETFSERNTPDFQRAGMKFNAPAELANSPQQLMLKGARSDLVLPTRTPDNDEPPSEPMDVDASTLLTMGSRIDGFFMARDGKPRQTAVSSAISLQDVNNPNVKQKSRYSFGLELTESTLDCSIELVDVSLSSTTAAQPMSNSFMATHPHSPCTQPQSQSHQQLPFRRQTSFELDESLGILTPDQMKEFLDSTNTNNTNNTNNMELPLAAHNANKMAMHHMRIDQTPSPEELPLDPVEVKTDVSEVELLLASEENTQRMHPGIFESKLRHAQQLQNNQQQQQEQQLHQQEQSNSNSTAEPISTNTDTDLSSKASEAMTKSNVSKISTSFITSVTSVTSLDTGYQGDGEMSRPASRGACDHSPSNGPGTRKGGHVSRQPSFNQQQQMPLVRRQDPMTDSDFFTESDADDILHRGDRRAQVIDGQLYGPMLQPSASVFISEDPEDSCMESSGIFTDVENRCDDDLAQMRRQDTQDAMLDMSPEGDADNSTETVKSTGKKQAATNRNKSENTIAGSDCDADGYADDDGNTQAARTPAAATQTIGQGQHNHPMSSSQTSSTIQSSMSADRLSAATLSNRTSYCSVDGSSTLNADSKSFGSMEEAFPESQTAPLTQYTHANNNYTNYGMPEPVYGVECANKHSQQQHQQHSTTGNERFAADSVSSHSDESHQPASVLKSNLPRKHASLNSLSTVNGATSSVAYDGAKVDENEAEVEDEDGYGENRYLSARERVLKQEREVHPEALTTDAELARATTTDFNSNSSACSSTSSLSVDNQNSKNINNTRHALEAAVAVAAAKAKKGGKIASAAGRSSNNNSPRTPRSAQKFISARNSPKQQPKRGSSSSLSSQSVRVASASDIVASGAGAGAGGEPLSTTVNAVRPNKKQTPNKWEAVMNKIQNNKALPKKNLKEIKSKVATLRSVNGGVGGVCGGVGDGATSSGRIGTKVGAGSGSVSVRANVTGGIATVRSSIAGTPLERRSPSSTAVACGGVMSPRSNGGVLPLRPADSGSQRSSSGSPTTAQQVSKRLFQGVAANRGRSYSKDSQKSSQSDLSMASAGGGSPKLLAKTPLRAAKKRDVRNLSISPTDLGPPPKAQQTAKGTSTRLKSSTIGLTQKRYPTQNVSATASTTSTAVSTPTGSGGGNLKVKTPPTVKKVVKDQNRGFGGVSTTKSNIKHVETPTELHEIHHNNNNNNHGISTATATTTTTTRTNSQSPSPILSYQRKKAPATAITTTTTGFASGVLGGALLEKKTQPKFLSSSTSVSVSASRQNKALIQKSHQLQRSAEETPVVSERLDAVELQRLKYLNRHSCNGRLDYEAIERHLEQTELQEAHRNKSIEVLGVLLQYAVHDLDAFACPRVKAEKDKIQTFLNTTLKLLDEAKTNCTRLQDQLCDKEGYYTQREEDLQTLHRCELEKAQTSLAEYQTFAQTRIAELETRLESKDAEHKNHLDTYRRELDNKLAQKQQQVEAAEELEMQLKERLSVLTISEKGLKEQLSSAESSYTAKLEVAAEREHQLNERLKLLTKEIEALRAAKVTRERELRDKLNLSQDEIAVLRSSQRSFNESMDRSSSGIGSPRNSSTSELARLQSEADSLHCVLELKQKEISKLTKQNEELMRDAEERTALQGKISLLESNNEMLKSELEIKSEKEKDFLRQMDDMQKAYNHEMVKRKRLSYDNEALQWQLKQRSEQLHIVETKLHELSSHESVNVSATHSSLGSFNRSQLQNGSSMVNIQMDDISPPTSPIVKGVIEKPDSVSWVLEMDDETPEAAASKMVKRAGSFRSNERNNGGSPSARRQMSGGSGGSGSNGNGPNPLSQSMSATSVIRQHSSDVRHEPTNGRAHSRIRSKSVCVKGTEPTTTKAPSATTTPTTTTATDATGSLGSKSGKRFVRHSSTSSSTGAGARKPHQLELINWKEPISASSPHPLAGLRTRTSTTCLDLAEEQQQQATTMVNDEHDQTIYHTPTSSIKSHHRKLITCDTSKLNSGERLDMHALPTHSSVHDLKKKFQEIQESAGEAMVSGANSEDDEGCSASSDEIVCSVSTSSSTTVGSTSSSLKNAHMSLDEEVLLLDKINSLNGTPMEISWSEDQVFSNGSAV